MTVLRAGDLLTSIRLPASWAGAHFYFEKIADRNVWDFPLVNVAAATVMSGDTIARMRIAVNGVAATPLRLPAVENAVARQAAAAMLIAGNGPCGAWLNNDIVLRRAGDRQPTAYQRNAAGSRELGSRRAVRGTEPCFTQQAAWGKSGCIRQRTLATSSQS